MKILVLVSVLCLIPFSGYSQDSLAELLGRYNEHKVPYITSEELAMPKTEAVILDAREQNEFKISHLKNAMYVGYNDFKIDTVEQNIPNKQTPLLVYCSLGIRSETIANKLKKAGYTNVKNLYGGIFDWKNKQFPVYNAKEIETDSIHAGSKSVWKWLKNGIKVYEKEPSKTQVDN